MSKIHPAREWGFERTYEVMQHALNAGHVNEQIGPDGLRLYCYTKETVYERIWTPATLIARGLILDVERKNIVATPFPKFFNYGEFSTRLEGMPIEEADKVLSLPNLPFEVFDKLDGSLIIIFWHQGKWRCATKGSFQSDQAQWAQSLVDRSLVDRLRVCDTYLCEVIYRQNRIVVNYPDEMEGLHLLAVYDPQGREYDYQQLKDHAYTAGLQIVNRREYSSISELVAAAKTLPATSEGWVLRFSDGTRIKIKGDEYCRIHRTVSNITPLAIWRNMVAGDDLDAIRRQIPEEFWEDFDTIVKQLNKRLVALLAEIEVAGKQTDSWTNKELGLRLKEFPDHIAGFLFSRRNDKLFTGRSRLNLFDTIRPTRNILEGYRASRSIERLLEDE